jgi:DNA polymerase-3 subunit alpha
VGSKNLNRKSLESLTKCGALATLAEPYGGRATLLEHIETLLTYHREAVASAPQDSLFGTLLETPSLTLPKGTPVSLLDKLAWEKELLGIYVSGHPLDAYPEVLKKAVLSIKKVLEDPQPGMLLILPVLITTVRSVVTKNGEKMSFLTLEDLTGSLEAVVFPRLFKEHAALLAPGACILVKAKVAKRNGETSLAIEELKPL